MSEIDGLQINNARKIYEASRNNDLVVFVGAGVSANSGVPDWGNLIQEFKNSLPESVKEEHDYLKVAQLYKESVPSGNYLNNIQDFLKEGKTHPNPIHEAILSLDPSHIITTNYDNLLEQAIENAKLHFSIIRSDKDVPFAKSSRYLIKMHGDFVSQKIVLTESDYYNYSNDYPLIDTLVKSIFASKTILCIGFSFNDLNLKIILNRIQAMLGNNAKPIYLLADYNNNPVSYNYLKNKGIQPFWLPCKIIEQFGKDAPNSLSSKKGIDIFKQLSCLKYDVSKPLDLIDSLYMYAQLVEGEMPFFYISRLRKILPDKICKWDHTYSMGIQLESEYTQAIIEQCKTIEGRRRLLREKGDKIHSLIQTAANNCIYEFDRIKLWKLKSFQRYWNSRERDCCALFIDFDFQALQTRINELELKKITYSNHDLELPFIKWMLGDLISSYEQYESLEQKYWKSGNAILYFICIFNKHALFNGSFPFGSMPYEKIEALAEKVGNIDLSRVLSDLSIDIRIKENLSDLINNQHSVDMFSSISNLANEILMDKYRSENGGFSTNSHIAELSSKLTRFFDYSHANYIITTNTGSAYETYRNGIIGLLNAHLIKDTTDRRGLFSGSRLEKIDLCHVQLMLFTLNAKDLKRILDIYRIESLLLSPEAISYLRDIINNILRDYQIIRRVLRHDILMNKLLSILILYLKTENAPNVTSEIIDIVLSYDLLAAKTQQDFPGIVRDILNKTNYSLSEKQCRGLISYLSEMDKTRDLLSLLTVVSLRMKENGWTYTVSFELRRPATNYQLLNEMYIYYDIVSKEEKENITKIIRDELKLSDSDLNIICAFILNKHAYELASLAIVDKIGAVSNKIITEHGRCSTLKTVFLNCVDEEIKNKVLELSSKNDRLRFYMDPISYEGKIDVQWLNCIDDESFRKILGREDVIQLIKNQTTDSKVVNRFLKMM